MELSALSSIPSEDMASLLSVFDSFSDMTDAGKADFLSAVQQEIANLYNSAGLPDYEVNNYADPLTPPTGGGYELRTGSGTATAVGTIITSEVNGIATPFNKIPVLTFTLPGVTSINPATGEDSLSVNGFVAFAIEETSFGYIASEPT